MSKVFLLICCLFFGLPQNCIALTITFNDKATVKGAAITLGDIASFDEQSDVVTALRSQEVRQSPPPGETVYLRSFVIQQSLLARQIVPKNTNWTGSSTVTLYRSGITINSSKILDIITEYIEDHSEALPEAETRFIHKSLPMPFILPHGNLSYEVIPSSPGILKSKRFSIIFRIDDEVARNMSVKGKVEALANVLVSTRKLRKGSILRPQDITQATKNISKISNPSFNPREILGKKLLKSVKEGDIIIETMVDFPPMVRRGERVKIVVKYENMVLTATGLSHNNGKLHDIIRVQNISSNKVVYCRVAAPGLVEVLL